MDMSSFSLEGKIALITGASYGIGMAIAKGMAAAGATIVFNDIKQELVDKGLAAYEEAGIKAHGYVCDVTNEDAVNEPIPGLDIDPELMAEWEEKLRLAEEADRQKRAEPAEEAGESEEPIGYRGSRKRREHISHIQKNKQKPF